MSFEMQIVEAFSFEDGRTALVGPLAGDEAFVKAGRCELFLGDKRQAVITLEGEMMPAGSKTRRDYRAVSTREPLQIDPEELGRGQYRLVRSNDQQQ